MAILFLILARGGSKGIPKKNITNFCDMPLMYWTMNQVQETEIYRHSYPHCIVSSDSEEIRFWADEYGFAGLKRPKEISQDNSTSVEAIEHVLSGLEHHYEAVIFLQVTSPLREPKDIDNAFKKFKDGNYDSLFSVCEARDTFIWEEKKNKLKSITYDYKNRKNRQDINNKYLENGSFYIFKPEVFLKYKNNICGNKIGYYVMEDWKKYEIDEMEDLKLCEYLFQTKILGKEASYA